MNAASRRGLLGALATLTASQAATAGIVIGSDAVLITACQRYLELERSMEDPDRPDHAEDIDKLPEYPEYLRTLEVMEATEPQTPAGCAALASVALLCDASIQQSPWEQGEGARIARKVLRHLAGSPVVQEECRLTQERARRLAEADARLNAMLAAQPAPGSYHDTRTPEQKLEGARMLLRVAEGMVRDAEAEVAAAVAL